MSKVRPTQCPYCQSPAIFDENNATIICEPCGAEYVITKSGGAKVKKMGVMDDHENRIAALEQSRTAPTPEDGLDPDPPEDPEETDGDNVDDDKEIFPE